MSAASLVPATGEIATIERDIARAYFGKTLTHEDDTLNTSIVRWIVEVNMPGAQPPVLSFSFGSPSDLVALAQRDLTLSNTGWEPTPDYILRTYGPGWRKKAIN